MFYLVDQNNSGGYFHVDDKVCHRLFIEADSHEEAKFKAEELGCYWNGVFKGIDCSCCGDRWNCVEEIDFEELKEYQVINFYGKKEWFEKYGKYTVVEEPICKKDFRCRYVGKISFSTIEEYAQYLTNEHAWTSPDARIYYKNGTVKEIFKEV